LMPVELRKVRISISFKSPEPSVSIAKNFTLYFCNSEGSSALKEQKKIREEEARRRSKKKKQRRKKKSKKKGQTSI